MKKTGSEWQKLKCYMETEKILLSTYSEKSRSLRTWVRAMDWPALDMELRELNDLSCQINEVDRKRAKSFYHLKKQYALSKENTLMDLTRHAKPGLGRELLDLQNHLKIITDRVRTESRVTAAYVEARNKSLHQLLGEILPETKHLCYGPAGKAVTRTSASRSLLVNRHF